MNETWEDCDKRLSESATTKSTETLSGLEEKKEGLIAFISHNLISSKKVYVN